MRLKEVSTKNACGLGAVRTRIGSHPHSEENQQKEIYGILKYALDNQIRRVNTKVTT
jgi:hypothetical protein